MNIATSLAEWINHKKPLFESLEPVAIVTMGDDGDLTPPFLGIAETGSSPFEQGGQTLHGVSTYEVTAELITVPTSEDQEGTPPETERLMRFDLTDIIANRDAIDFCNGRNYWSIFDIRTGMPMTEAQEGRRVSRWNITIVAAPL